jgi:hypothetical protein
MVLILFLYCNSCLPILSDEVNLLTNFWTLNLAKLVLGRCP